MGNITVTSDSVISIPAHTINDIAAHTINNIEGHTIDSIKAIAPVATHIKEVNHIDPISVESLHVHEIKNVEPLQVERLNVTNLPAVNMSLRQLPPLDVSIRRVPPLSVGLHQHLDIPSDYTLRASFLGLECVRVRINGRSTVVPREAYRREVSRTLNRSYQEVAAGGNPAIPSNRTEQCVTVECTSPPPMRHVHQTLGHGPVPSHHGGAHMETGCQPTGRQEHCDAMPLRCGPPVASFGLCGGQRHAGVSSAPASKGG